MRDALATNNKRVKSLAGTLNALALGIVGFAILRPLTDALGSPVGGATAWWAGAGLGLHGANHYVLRYLRRADP